MFVSDSSVLSSTEFRIKISDCISIFGVFLVNMIHDQCVPEVTRNEIAKLEGALENSAK